MARYGSVILANPWCYVGGEITKHATLMGPSLIYSSQMVWS